MTIQEVKDSLGRALGDAALETTPDARGQHPQYGDDWAAAYYYALKHLQVAGGKAIIELGKMEQK